jgi:hypothetical protein
MSKRPITDLSGALDHVESSDKGPEINHIGNQSANNGYIMRPYGAYVEKL